MVLGMCTAIVPCTGSAAGVAIASVWEQLVCQIPSSIRGLINRDGYVYGYFAVYSICLCTTIGWVQLMFHIRSSIRSLRNLGGFVCSYFYVYS